MRCFIPSPLYYGKHPIIAVFSSKETMEREVAAEQAEQAKQAKQEAKQEAKQAKAERKV